MDKFDDIQCEDYALAFPEYDEFIAWTERMEESYREECALRASLTITEKVSLKYNTEELSPFSTVNS